MKGISEYCETNILVIPQALYSMRDATSLLDTGSSVIFYKSLEEDLVDVEFYTNMPCVVYIESGKETITTSDNVTHYLKANTAIFLPQGLNLHSDYVRATENLKAYLIFYDQNIISDFLSSSNGIDPSKDINSELITVKCTEAMNVFFQSFQVMNKERCDSSALIRLKLLELLHLLAADSGGIFQAALSSATKTLTPKRNLVRLLRNDNVVNLSVSDLAHLSGRSVSSFFRDFKATYGMPPKQWLQERRLSRAYTLLTSQELTVTEVALDVGFENISHFIQLFKSRYQITPKQLMLSQ